MNETKDRDKTVKKQYHMWYKNCCKYKKKTEKPTFFRINTGILLRKLCGNDLGIIFYLTLFEKDVLWNIGNNAHPYLKLKNIVRFTILFRLKAKVFCKAFFTSYQKCYSIYTHLVYLDHFSLQRCTVG